MADDFLTPERARDDCTKEQKEAAHEEEHGSAQGSENETAEKTANRLSEAERYVRQAFEALESRRFDEAGQKCDKALELDPEYAQAYLCKLLAEYRLTAEDELKKSRPFDRSKNYICALRYANSALADMLTASAKAAGELHKRRILVFVVVLLLLIIGCFCWYGLVVAPNEYYESVIGKAETLLDNGMPDDAFIELKKIEGNRKARYMLDNDPRLRYAVGRTIPFGRYDQDYMLENGTEDLQWQILARDEDDILLMSEYALTFLPFRMETDTVSWGNSDIRKWLNGSFMEQAFTEEEAQKILEVDIPAQADDGTDLDLQDSGNDQTKDRIFLLSLDEAERYLVWNALMTDNEFTPGAVREFYIVNGKQMNDIENIPAWWTRTVKRSDDGTYSVESIRLTDDGYHKLKPANSTEVAVRPAMWIHIGGQSE